MRHTEPLENLYFNWLYAKLIRVPASIATLSLTFDTLLKTLHNVEFIWLVVGDDNRAEDGKELRREFLIAADAPDHPEWRTQIPCSVLEMLLVFCNKAQQQTGIPARDWFWEIMENLNLKEANDASEFTPEDIQEVLEHFLYRQYRNDGDGGLFPLNHPTRDQTKIEIWDQFCDYLVDRNRLP